MDITMYKPKGRIEHNCLLNLLDYSAPDIYEILRLAKKFKSLKRRGKKHKLLKGKTVAIFAPTSPAALRVPFELASRELGAYPLLLPDTEITGEFSAHDVSLLLARYGADAAVIITPRQKVCEDVVSSGLTVINGGSDEFDPCGALADLFTVEEHMGALRGAKLAYFGRGNSAVHSLMLAGAKAGMSVYVCSPDGYGINPSLVAAAQKFGNVVLTASPEEAATAADVVYTAAYGKIDKTGAEALLPYRVTTELFDLADKNAVFMRPLPAVRGDEVTAEVMDSVRSVAFEQAENRLHIAKSVLCLLAGKK